MIWDPTGIGSGWMHLPRKFHLREGVYYFKGFVHVQCSSRGYDLFGDYVQRVEEYQQQVQVRSRNSWTWIRWRWLRLYRVRKTHEQIVSILHHVSFRSSVKVHTTSAFLLHLTSTIFIHPGFRINRLTKSIVSTTPATMRLGKALSTQIDPENTATRENSTEQCPQTTVFSNFDYLAVLVMAPSNVLFISIVHVTAPAVLSFDNVSVSTKPKRGKPTKFIINKIQGCICGGLWGIMGASGSGKTTLLSVLSLRLDTHRMEIEGDVRINGKEYNKNLLKSMSGYVMQDDLVHAELTVVETLLWVLNDFYLSLCYYFRIFYILLDCSTLLQLHSSAPTTQGHAFGRTKSSYWWGS